MDNLRKDLAKTRAQPGTRTARFGRRLKVTVGRPKRSRRSGRRDGQRTRR